MIILPDLATEDKMGKTIGVLFLVVLFFMELAVPLVTAAECDYGSVNASVRTSDGVWRHATTHPVLKRGETFDIQVIVTTKTVLQVLFLKLHEYGTPVFEVITGPTAIDQLLESRGEISSGKTFIYTWTVYVRPDTSWVNGYAPLEVFVQFNTNDTDEHRITFDVLTAYIIDELWENYSQANTTKKFFSTHPSVDTQSDLEFGPIIGAVLLFCIFIRSRRNAH